MLKTPLTELWGLRYPILNASMTPAAGGKLARAVTEAGGFGMIGVNETWTTADVDRECAIAREGDPTRRFGIGLFGWGLEAKPELLQRAIEQKPFFISISFLDISPYAGRVHDAGILLGAQVQTRRDAEAALRGGVDVLIAQGTEAGGHTGDVSTFTMMQIALALTDKPVLVAGGVATACGLAAVLGAGAAGAWIGTPFLLADEANVSDAARERILAADETQTILTSLFDRLQGFPWPQRFRGRALQNEMTRKFHGREDQALADSSVVDSFRRAKQSGDFTLANIYAGQSVGLLSSRYPAHRIVEELGEGAERLLRRHCFELLA
jgi:nitronate monooxygenase